QQDGPHRGRGLGLHRRAAARRPRVHHVDGPAPAPRGRVQEPHAMSIAVTPVIRRVTAEEYARVTASVGAWLEIDTPLAHTYPQVFGPGARARLFATFCDGEPVSHAALDTVRWRSGGSTLAIGLVGSVATAPGHRRGGFASELLRHVSRIARQEQLDAL